MNKCDLITIFMKNSGGLSSKRILAFLCTIVCLGLLIAAFILDRLVPDFADLVFIGSLSLYGIELIPTFSFKKEK